MKRYWKLLVLAPFIVVCIGTYYAQASGGGLPEYVLQKQEGDDKESAPLTIKARYQSESVSINSNGSQYESEQSFWETLGPVRMQSPLRDLVKAYPDFMRGKINPYAAYEDDQVLGYADTRGENNAPFQISIYDKKLKKESSFDIRLPKQNTYEFISAQDVQVEQQTLKLVTLNSIRSTGAPSSQEVHLYTMNLDKKVVESDRLLFSGDAQGENTHLQLVPAVEQATTKQKRYIVFQAVHYKVDNQKGGPSSQTNEKRELLAYDLGSGKQTAIEEGPIGEILKGTMGLTLHQEGSDLFLAVGAEAKGPRVIRYDLAEHKIKSDFSIAVKDYQPSSDGLNLNHMAIGKNRLYTAVSTTSAGRNEPVVVIADLNSGGVVYQGTVVRKDQEPLSNFMLEDLVVE